MCIFLLLSPIILYSIGSSKINSFQSLKIQNNKYVIRVISSNIDLEKFYGNSDTVEVISDLIEISEPDPNTKTIFLWPEGIIPNINQKNSKNLIFCSKKNLMKIIC